MKAISEQNKQLMDIYRERFRALLKRFRLQASTTDPGRLFLSHMIRVGKKYIFIWITLCCFRT